MANLTGLRVISETVRDGKLVVEVVVDNKKWAKVIESGIICNNEFKVPGDSFIGHILSKYDWSCFNYVGRVSVMENSYLESDMLRIKEFLNKNPSFGVVMDDADIVVTDNSNQPSREDKSGQYQEAETHVNNIIQDFDKGNVTRTDTKRVYDRAGRALRDHDLARGIGKL